MQTPGEGCDSRGRCMKHSEHLPPPAICVVLTDHVSPFRLQCFRRTVCTVLDRADIPVAGLGQWTTVEVRFVEIAQVDCFAA